MAVIGYVSATSALPGDSIGFHLSADPAGDVTLTVERVGAIATSAQLTASVPTRSEPPGRPWEDGFGWPVTAEFEIPDDWPTGLYRLVNPAQPSPEICAFVVRPTRPGRGSRMLVHVSFLTPQAYNPNGGKSLYAFNSKPNFDEASRASRVSFERPPDQPPAEGAFIEWLEAEGFEADYCASIDLHGDAGLLSNYECLVLSGHDEYWTRSMRELVETFVARGGNLVSLSGNTAYRQVRLEDDARTLVFHKYATDDPVDDDLDVTVAFAEPPVNRPQNTMLGVGWTQGGWSGAARDVALDRYLIRFPDHWVFEDVPAAAGDPPLTIPFLNYETDAAAFVEEEEGYPRVTGEEGTPLSFTVLASADLRGWPEKPGFATLGTHVRNGTVFTASATDWIGTLGDPSIAQITRNVLRRLRRRIEADWEPVDHPDRAASGRAMASLGDRMFMATTDDRLQRRFPVGAPVPWRDVGHAIDVIAMAGSGDTLYAVNSANQLWWRPAVDEEVEWTRIGSGPAAGTAALAAAAGLLYAVDKAGAVWRTAADRGAAVWTQRGAFAPEPRINAMTAHGDVLIACTSDNRLIRSNHGFINESTGWVRFHHCNNGVGLAAVDGMLFVATSQPMLWRMDLHGMRTA